MRNYFIQTREGQVVFSANEAVMDSDGPVTLMIHGAYRGVRTLAPWVDRVTRPVFAHLPGHSGAPVLSGTGLDVWTRAFSAAASALRRKILAVGESVGGLVALGLPVEGVVAVDPFFETSKLWPLRHTLEAAAARGLPSPAAAILAPGNVYYGQFDLCRVVPEIIIGDEPLGAPRPMDRTPSFVDAADLARIGDRARIHRIMGGHALLDENPEACLAVIKAAYNRLS